MTAERAIENGNLVLPKMKPMTADDLRAALRDRFPVAEYALFFEVRNGTGFQRTTRSADALAMSLWPSRGLDLHGFEIKVDRRDWMRELKDPAKAEEIARFCNRWWLVVSDASLVRDGELPPTWGLLAMKDGKLKVVKEAPALTPQPVTPLFLASVLRSAQAIPEQAISQRVESEVMRRVDAEIKFANERAERAEKQAAERVEDLRRKIDAFERVSGLRIDGYHGPKIAEAVKFVREGGLAKVKADAQRALAELQRVADVARVVAESDALH